MDKHLGLAADLHSPIAFQTWNEDLSKAVHGMDTALRLNSSGTSSVFCSDGIGVKRKWSDSNPTEGSQSALLSLGLGCSPSSSGSSKDSSGTACTMSSVKQTDEESSMDMALNFQLYIGNENTSIRKKLSSATTKASGTGSIFDLQLSLSAAPPASAISSRSPISSKHQNSSETSGVISQMPNIDEDSIESHWKLGSSQVLSLPTSETIGGFFPKTDSVPPRADILSTTITALESLVACTSSFANPQQRSSNSKTCQFQGCGKGARGASGLCIAHGGGRRCQKVGCQKGAEGRTIYCKAHGGGRRCENLGCTKSAEGRTDYCIAHGGGRRCSHKDCTRAARGKSGLCIRHGGGKRCQRENCTKSAEGHSGLCISHGGGRRCQYPECTKGAQGSTKFCKAHGGGKRCTVLGCTKGAEGSTPFCKGHGGGKRCLFQGGGVCPKSVHGGTQFCVAHGGGKRCAVPGCTKSARGRTDFCVKHGGGKRCKFPCCGKSAQGSTDFCKAHGGGKRCSWGQPGSSFGAGGLPCDRFARGRTGLCATHAGLVQDHCVHGGGTLISSASQDPIPIKFEKKNMASGHLFSNIDNSVASVMGWNSFEPKKNTLPLLPVQSALASLPEGRVHGGGLMAMLASNAAGSNSGPKMGASTSEQGAQHAMVHRWV